MTRKTLNTEAVINELRGQSVFFQKTPPAGQPPERPGSQETKRPGGREVKKLASQEARRPPDEPAIAEGWEEEMVWKGSYLYTESERNLFDEVVLRLREAHGLEVQKRLLARAAIRLLASDFKQHGEDSFIVALLTRQVKKWVERLTSQEARRSGSQPAEKPAS